MIEAQLQVEATQATLSHQAFVTAWHDGKIRVAIDSAAAATLVSARLLLPFVSTAIIGLGIGLVFWRWTWLGLALGAIGILAPKLIKRSAAGFLLARLPEDPELYAAALECRALSYTPIQPATTQ